MGNSKGIRDGIRQLMGSKKNKLHTYNDLMEELDMDETQAKATLYQLWKQGNILLHKEKDVDYGNRYAINIAEDNIKPYEQTRFIKKRTSREPLTKEDIESYFQDLQNACLVFDSLLNRAMELETRLINQLEESDKTTTLIQEMKSRMAGINF